MSETEQAISIDDRGRELIRGAIDETMIQVVDALFRHFAQQVGPQTGFSIEKATAGLWGLFERGDLRLVASDDGGLIVETCGENRAERRVQARKNRRLVEFKGEMRVHPGGAVEDPDREKVPLLSAARDPVLLQPAPRYAPAPISRGDDR